MKRGIAGIGILILGVALGRLFNGSPSPAEAGGGRVGGVEECSAENGDVNADAKINLTDAVTILTHLFQGSPTALAPICMEPPVEAPAGLPDSSQTKCYASGGAEIPCENANCPGQDAAHETGCPPQERFVDNQDGTVTDTCTGLTWQQSTADVNGDGRRSDTDVASWCAALSYCDKLAFAGHDDWRLPNVRELESLVDYGRNAPSIDPVFTAFPSQYWSSTSRSEQTGNAWYILFRFGDANGDAKGVEKFVRAVRG